MKQKILYVLLMSAGLLLSSCGDLAGNSQNSMAPDTSVPATDRSSIETPTSDSVDESIERKIFLRDNATTFSGSGISVQDNTVIIYKPGSYTVSGSLSNGSIYITDNSDQEVELILNGVSITQSGNNTLAPIYSANKSKLKIKKYKGTTSTITDNRVAISDDADDSAAIFSNKKLSIVGAGTLNVVGNLKNGVGSDTKIEAKNGTLSIKAKNKGMKADKSIVLGHAEDEGVISIEATDNDGINVEKKEGDTFDEGEVQGVQFNKGTFTIVSKDKGVKSGYDVEILDGTLNITSTGDDGINAENDVYVKGGTTTISAGDDGIHADNKLVVSGGTNTVTKSFEGFEGLNVEISGGTNSVIASDDGLNAGGGNDSASQETPWGPRGGGSNSSALMTISGGMNYIQSTGDGIDSNGNFYVTGGVSFVNQSKNCNGPLDYGDGAEFKQSGGTLVAYGSSDMLVTSSGTQYSFLGTYSSGVSTSNYFAIANGGYTWLVKPQTTTAYSLYISSNEFVEGSVVFSYVSNATATGEILRGVYKVSGSVAGTQISGGTWSSSTINLGETGGGHGGGPGGGGSRPQRP
ncbi:MAG: carbohydrate-binding domain-containing protein [Bacilli bacterium]|nr:carbohydrate-binding domain-containing protein [Bacilli bacterium]